MNQTNTGTRLLRLLKSDDASKVVAALGLNELPDSPEKKNKNPFFDGNKFLPTRLGDAILEKQYFADVNGELLIYDDGVYRPGGEAAVQQACCALLGEEFRENRVREVVYYVKTRCHHDPGEFNASVNLLNLKNGILDWISGKLTPHTPKFFSTIQIPVEYNPNADCPRIHRFLSEVLPQDSIPLAQELMGYCLIPTTRLEKAFLLTGRGCNGKSTFLNLLRAFIGPQNVSNRSLQELAENRFALSDVVGKLLNVYADLEARALESSGLFKSLVSGDTLTAERKYQPAFQFTPFVRLLFSANEPPGSRDTGFAFFRRWIVINFPNDFSQNPDPGLIDQLTIPEELSGLLNLAIKGLKRLTKQGKFSEPLSAMESLQNYIEQIDSVAAFVTDQCALRSDTFSPKQEVYNAYRNWCEQQGLHPVSQRRFNCRLTEGWNVHEERPQGGARFWRGISVNRSLPF